MKTVISISEDELDSIKEFCKEKDIKMSSLFRQGAKRIISESNAIDPSNKHPIFLLKEIFQENGGNAKNN